MTWLEGAWQVSLQQNFLKVLCCFLSFLYLFINKKWSFFIFTNLDYDYKIKETISNYSVKSLESDNFVMGLIAEQDDNYNDLNKNRIFEEG